MPEKSPSKDLKTADKKENKKKKARQEGLWIPNSILNLPELNWGEKVLLAQFYSFGIKGCWKSNKTLAEEFMTSKQTISRMISRLKKYIRIKNPKGYYRTIWVKSHPKVKDFIPGKEFEVNQKCASGLVKNDNSTSSKQAIGPNQKCATTYTYTNKDNNNSHAQEESVISFTIEHVKDAAITVGLTKEQAARFFHHYKSQGWLLGNGQPITDLASALVRWRNNEHKFERYQGSRGIKQSPNRQLSVEEVNNLTGG